jgi:amino acid transporter/nucleotide-binding universal stress UspA family protein
MSSAHVELSRDLSLFDITMIGVGAMIGAGIFVLTGIAAGAAGPALILSFALNGIVTVFTAMVYAELGSAIPEAGGGYLWVKEGLPGPNAFLAGWMSWFAHAVAGSLYGLGFGSYLTLVLEEFNISLFGFEGEWLHKGLAVLVILLFLYINFRGSSETGLAGNVITVLKVVILAIFIVSGLIAIFQNPSYFAKFENFAPRGFSGILIAMGLTFIAFEGYEIIVQAGEEVKDPRRTIPKAVFLSLAIVIPIYMLVAFVTLGAVNPETSQATYQWLADHAELGVAEAARQFMPFGTFLLLVGGILSTMSALNATTFSSTRVSFAMGRDKNLPDAFGEVHASTRTPHKALFWSGLLILVMAVTIPIEDVAAAADIMFLLLFLQVNVAVITIRKKYGDRLNYGYLMPFFPVVPIIGIVTKLFLAVFMFNYSPIAWVFAVVWLIVGSLLFYAYARPRMKESEWAPIIAESKLIPRNVEPDQYRVLVPIANPASLQGLLEPAVNAARQHKGAISLLHVVNVPAQLPLSAGRQYIEQSNILTDRALSMLEELDVGEQEIPVETVFRISHDVVEAIVETARERYVDLLIMGWRGQSRTPDTAVGQHVDAIIDQVNCRVLIVQQELHTVPQSILIPVLDPRQIRFALETVGLLTGNQIAHKKIFRVFPPGAPTQQRNAFIHDLEDQIMLFDTRYPKYKGTVTYATAEGSDPVTVISDEAKEHDYVILGATRDSWLKRQFFGSKPSRIANDIDVPVALIRPRTPLLGFGLRRILQYIRGGYREIEPASETMLREHGILRPPSERYSGELHTAVNTTRLLIVGLLALVSVTLMYLGDGGPWTWVGSIAFIVVLGWFTWISIRPSADPMPERRPEGQRHQSP